jgi:hypothetical protein
MQCLRLLLLLRIREFTCSNLGPDGAMLAQAITLHIFVMNIQSNPASRRYETSVT